MTYDTQNIRNVVLLGHSGSGKTTLAETMLYESGGIHKRGSIEEGNTSSDYHQTEIEKGNSLFTSLLHAFWDNVKINILDTPGLDDFIGDVISAVKVADTAVMVLNAKEGVEVGTEILWEYIEENNTPAIFVINQIDHVSADFEKTLTQARERFGNKVLEFQFPYDAGDGKLHIVDALRMTMYSFDDDGGKPEKSDIPEEAYERAQLLHNSIVEVAAENEEGLMEAYFEKGNLSEEELTKGLRLAIANQECFPVFCVSAQENKGSGRVMGFIRDICPSPAHRPAKLLADGERLECNKDGKTSVFIYKTLTEPQVGNVSYFKVYSGKLKPGDELINQSNAESERFNQIFVANGKSREQVDELVAGDIGVVLKLHDSHTGNTLNAKGFSKKIAAMKFPSPKMRMAVAPPNKSDVDKLTRALHTIQEEDPTIKVEYNSEIKQTILHGQGQLHFDIIKYHIEKLFGLELEFERAKIPYRETITRSADAHYRHKKQSGGAGQFAEIQLRVEPYEPGMDYPADMNVKKDDETDLPWGGKLSILWCIVGGTIDAKYFNAIKKGIMSVMEEGPLTGSYCQDIRVCIYDGKMHSVDSNDMAFQIAAAQAFSEAFKQAKPRVLEPLYNLEVLCDAEVIGEIMSDLQSRRAMILGIESEGHYQKITAKVPVAELYGFSSSLRTISKGKAKFSRHMEGYQPMDKTQQQEMIAAE